MVHESGSSGILIDGAFLRHKLGTRNTPATAEDIYSFTQSLSSSPELEHHQLHRIYYYDAMPLDIKVTRPVDKEVIDFSSSTKHHSMTTLIEALKLKPHFAVRLGSLDFQGWYVPQAVLNKNLTTLSPSSLKSQITQKGVDMRIGMDMASLTLKRIVDAIVLVSGDSDFVPAMKLVRREGALIYTVPLDHQVKKEFTEHSDVVITLNPQSPRNEGNPAESIDLSRKMA